MKPEIEMKEVKYIHGDCLVGFAVVENVGVETKTEVLSHSQTEIQPCSTLSRCSRCMKPEMEMIAVIQMTLTAW